MLPLPPPTQHDPLQTISNAYGMWHGAMTVDPSGNLVGTAIKNAVISGTVGASVGYVLPGFKPMEGAKWGALLGIAQTIFYFMRGR
jgi:hypothetical protein